MPRNGQIAHQTVDITVTNGSLLEKHEEGFVLSLKCHEDGGSESGGKQYLVTASENDQAVILSSSLQELFAKGDGHPPVFYASRSDYQDTNLPTAKDSNLLIHPQKRLGREMALLTLKQDGQELIHLNYRGRGASDAKTWGGASRLINSAINSRSTYAILNKTTGILADGRIAIFVPAECQDTSMIDLIKQDAESNKKESAKKVPELKLAFERKAGFIYIPAKMTLPERHDSVYFRGVLKGDDVKCVVNDDADHNTTAMMFNIVAEIPSGVSLVAIDGEGYGGPSTLVNKKFLQKETDFPLMAGLRKLII